MSNQSQAGQEQMLSNLLATMDESDRLAGLSDLELIRETLNDEVADDPCVSEMMGRIYPKWFDEPEPPAMPQQPRSVCVAIRFDVAHDVVAFSECHCEESVARGESETNTEAYKPCLYCACNAALYRATKLDMYKPEN